MPNFRVFLLNGAGRIEVREEIEAPSDEAAISIGQALLKRHPVCAGFEIWDRTRIVHKELHEQPKV
jgi:hypothetical protein